MVLPHACERGVDDYVCVGGKQQGGAPALAPPGREAVWWSCRMPVVGWVMCGGVVDCVCGGAVPVSGCDRHAHYLCTLLPVSLVHITHVSHPFCT